MSWDLSDLGLAEAEWELEASFTSGALVLFFARRSAPQSVNSITAGVVPVAHCYIPSVSNTTWHTCSRNFEKEKEVRCWLVRLGSSPGRGRIVSSLWKFSPLARRPPLAPFNLRHLPNQFCVNSLSVHWIIGDLYDGGLIILGGIFNRLVFLNLIIYLFLAVLVFIAALGLSQVVEEGYSSPWCTGFSLCWLLCCRAQAPEWGVGLCSWAMGLAVCVACGIFLTGAWLHVPCIGRWISVHWYLIGKSHTGNYLTSVSEKAIVSRDRVLGSYRYQQLRSLLWTYGFNNCHWLSPSMSIEAQCCWAPKLVFVVFKVTCWDESHLFTPHSWSGHSVPGPGE